MKTELATNGKLKFGVFDNVNSYTHFYDFTNFLAIHNVEFFETNPTELSDLLKCNTNNPIFKNALDDYLFFYKHGIKKNVSWSQIPSLLNSGEIDCCFVIYFYCC